MNTSDPLQIFRQVMWVSGIISAGLVLLLLFLTTWRASWLRMLNWEESLWRCWGLGKKLATRLRRVEDSKWLVIAVAGLLLVHFTLLAVSVGAQLYFGPKLKARAVHSAPLKSQQPNR